MDVIFNCPNCDQELQVDASASGSEIQCPTCNEGLIIPAPEQAKSVTDSQPLPSSQANPPKEGGAPLPEHSGAIASSAAAKVHVHFKVPQHQQPAESLIQKPNKPLEVAAKDTEKKIRVKTIRHTDCMEVGHDNYDNVVSEFLQKVGRENIISISPINYTHMDLGTRQLMTEYGVSILYVG